MAKSLETTCVYSMWQSCRLRPHDPPMTKESTEALDKKLDDYYGTNSTHYSHSIQPISNCADVQHCPPVTEKGIASRSVH